MEVEKEFKIGEKVVLIEFDVNVRTLPEIVKINGPHFKSHEYDYTIGTYGIGVKKEWLVKVSPVMLELLNLEDK